ncbi:MAG: acyl-CoA thioesterase, partial [Ruminiclostridium sp.]
NLQFKAAAYINSTIFMCGQITYVGTTSMEVRVNTYVENLDGMRHMINRAYLVLVALDENDHPAEIPGIMLETDEERLEWEAGEKRSQLRKQRRLEAY